MGSLFLDLGKKNKSKREKGERSVFAHLWITHWLCRLYFFNSNFEEYRCKDGGVWVVVLRVWVRVCTCASVSLSALSW